jgi:hypothetical protein
MSKKAKIKDLKPDPKNANVHSQYGMGLLENSTRLNGVGRSILISKDNVIIAGNGLVEAAGGIGIEDVEIVESDGNKIIAVKRTDIQSGTTEFYNMALADNVTAMRNIVLDAKVVEAIAEELPESQFWTEAALDIINPERLTKSTDVDKANRVQMSFLLSSHQAADVQKALKISKQINQKRFSQAGNDNPNGNAIYFIVEEFLNKYGDVQTE